MLIKLTGGTVYDPMHGINGEVRDIYIRDGRIINPPPGDMSIDQEYPLNNKIIMAGAIDIHSHIGGGNVNIARTLLPEGHHTNLLPRTELLRAGSGRAIPSTFATGYRYAEMGYTAVFEPAVLPMNARQAHMEMGDTPLVDKGGYALLGNDDYGLRMLAANKDQKTFNNYVAWILKASQCLGIKVVNPGGINAFKFNQRRLDLDEPGPFYGVTPRQILLRLARAVHELDIPHPIHVHGCNLGVPGNLKTTLSTIEGIAGLPMHLAHIQFHSYGAEGDRKFSSGAAQIAEAVNRHPNITVDVGQILFGQTVTVSSDTMQQYASHPHAYPKKWAFMDIECDAGCGIVPFKYQDKHFVNALQWAIGLEIFLLVDDPWRVFLTTDHPNGAPFVSYPHLIRLLMDRSFRNDMLATIHPEAAQASTLGTITREYSLYEIAIMTRAGAAKLLGLSDRGHLGIGAAADITVYTEQKDKEKMFSKPDYVFKDGELVVRNGEIVKVTWGATHVVRPEFDNSIEKELSSYFDRYLPMKISNFKINDEEMTYFGRGHIQVHPCRERNSF
ncbi:formylmethanofuran dehydrogenase, subunit A [Nitrosococcus oceani ATCC 19707]|uniref:Formylmethanofuran dehydrogenase, subunit A n=2 Tax=Nitrosococcus oceani TaxID=1229 RepID=Q3JF30_NITOC|nr:formylmethanofuran dehydrogenase subunit A [Nitrosococcus oceani]ABA56566.1 formylmethanofuran dehydrogenase, subunit A [Nitrosococcus oceani ATCC 19707]EDZ65620.1 formylmethanofuran dehydrogenase subunit A [Nitrosococcus oceani AFC27]KFI20992.1 formylmethanofuran dehydrogenase [Nitrosococcus oceani C-27]GEM21602.1 formylmethanofuran dehydrogenase subunit A [Nitrosococcus oceani]